MSYVVMVLFILLLVRFPWLMVLVVVAGVGTSLYNYSAFAFWAMLVSPICSVALGLAFPPTAPRKTAALSPPPHTAP